MNTSQFPIAWVRDCFPVLNNGEKFVFFDNGAGAQVPQTVLDAVQHHVEAFGCERLCQLLGNDVSGCHSGCHEARLEHFYETVKSGDRSENAKIRYDENAI